MRTEPHKGLFHGDASMVARRDKKSRTLYFPVLLGFTLVSTVLVLGASLGVRSLFHDPRSTIHDLRFTTSALAGTTATATAVIGNAAPAVTAP
jgi:hypothetical protein